MNFFQTFLLALKNIVSSKLRSLLTALGIIIGISGVIVIVGMGNGMENYMADSFESLGTDLLTVSIIGTSSSENVTEDDMYVLVAENPEYLANVSPTVTVMGSVKIGNETLGSTGVTGISEAYASMKRYEVGEGRFIQYVDILTRAKACVVGSYISKEWFGGDAVGQTIRINGSNFTIVGTLAEESESEEGGTDDAIYIPYSTAARISSTGVISAYTFEVASEENVSASKRVIEDALLGVYGTEDAYRIISMSEILDMMNTMLDIMVSVLAAIAGISLVVGGIGIMNIMLVSVSERTREIGIRKALGAKQRFIMRQFVIEAATISAIGGAAGIGFGYVLSWVATLVITTALDVEITVVPSLWSILLAFGISAGIGVLFGYLPAKKAARLNPIDALRYE